MTAAPTPCPTCGRTAHQDGCSHVECPCRRPWHGHPLAGLERLIPTERSRGPVPVGSDGCYRVIARKGAE